MLLSVKCYDTPYSVTVPEVKVPPVDAANRNALIACRVSSWALNSYELGGEELVLLVKRPDTMVCTVESAGIKTSIHPQMPTELALDVGID